MKEQLTERPVDSFGFTAPEEFDQDFAASEAKRYEGRTITTEVEDKHGLVHEIVVTDESAPQSSIPVRVA